MNNPNPVPASNSILQPPQPFSPLISHHRYILQFNNPHLTSHLSHLSSHILIDKRSLANARRQTPPIPPPSEPSSATTPDLATPPPRHTEAPYELLNLALNALTFIRSPLRAHKAPGDYSPLPPAWYRISPQKPMSPLTIHVCRQPQTQTLAAYVEERPQKKNRSSILASAAAVSNSSTRTA
jgi:hypothetical protein